MQYAVRSHALLQTLRPTSTSITSFSSNQIRPLKVWYLQTVHEFARKVTWYVKMNNIFLL